MLDYDAGESPELPATYHCQSVLYWWPSDTTRHPRSTCLERSQLIVGRQYTSTICVTIPGNCLQTSQRLPMRNSLRDVQFGFVSLPKTFVSPFWSILFQHSHHDGRAV